MQKKKPTLLSATTVKRTPAHSLHAKGALAAVALGALLLPMQAETIEYDGSDSSLLHPDPIGQGLGSLFPQGTLQGNQVNLIGGTIEGGVFGSLLYFEDATNASAASNIVTVAHAAPHTQPPIFINDSLYGGYASTALGNAEAIDNRTTLQDGQIHSSVYGGYAQSNVGTARVATNRVTFSGGTIDGHIAGYTLYGSLYGGFAVSGQSTAEATSNTVIVTGGTAREYSIYGEFHNGRIYGGFARGASGMTTTANENIVMLSGGTVGSVYGGSSSQHAEANKVSALTGSQINGDIYGGYVSAVGVDSAALDNVVVILGGAVNRGATDGSLYLGNVYGGYAGKSLGEGDTTADGNLVEILAGSVGGSTYGGYAGGGGDNVLATHNRVVLSGGTVGNNIYGGHSNGGHTSISRAENNVVEIVNGEANAVHGGYADGDHINVAANNMTKVSGGQINHNVIGGTINTSGIGLLSSIIIIDGNDRVSNTVENNAVEITGGLIANDVHGGYLYDYEGNATNLGAGNTVEISGGSIGGNVYGVNVLNISRRGEASAENNHVEISADADIHGDVYGGSVVARGTATATATGNTVTLTGGTVGGSVYGGYAANTTSEVTITGLVTASNNAVNILGGTIHGNIYGGEAYNPFGLGISTDNVVTIHSAADVSASRIYGGIPSPVGGIDGRKGNTLNLHGENIEVSGIANFQHYNFYLSGTTTGHQPLLTITEDKLFLHEEDTGVIDLGLLIGDIGLHDTLVILLAAAGLEDGSETAFNWDVVNYGGATQEGYDLTAFWLENTLQLGWTPAIPEPAVYGALLALASLALATRSHRRKRTA